MAAHKEIRRLQNTHGTDFDDQAWLINCALLVLAGSIVGVVVAVSDFDDPRILYNGYARLVSVAAIVAGLFAAIKWLEGRMLRRVQFCILMSLLAHFWLDVYLYNSYMAMMAAMEARAEQPIDDPAERVTVPDYVWTEQKFSELKSEYDEPVDTPTPEQPKPEPVEKRDARDVPIEPEKPLEVETPPLEQPNPAEMQRHELSAPRRELTAGGQLSRQPWRQQPQPDEPIPQPQFQPAGQPAAPDLRPQDAAVARQQPRAKTPERRTFEEPSVEQQQEAMRLARRGSEQTPARESPTTPSPTRQLAHAADALKTEAKAPDPARAASVAQTAPLQPKTEQLVQRAGELPKAASPAAPPSPTPTTPDVAGMAAPRRSSEPQPQMAQAAPAMPQRSSASPELPPITTEALPETAQAAASTASTLVGPSTEVSRQATAAAPQTSHAASAQAPQAAGPSEVAVNQPRRAAASSGAEPSAAPPVPRAGRTTSTPSLASATVAEAAPATAAETQSQPSLAMTSPGGGAIERQAASVASVAAPSTAGQAVPPMSRADDLPAVAARRAAASQTSPVGSADAPAAPRTIARQPSGVSLPSATAPLETAVAATPATPAAAGAAAGSRLEASSRAAAVERSSSSAPSGSQIAAAGAAELAVGAAPIEARMGQPRGRGPLEPSSQASTSQAPRPARTPSGATPGASGAADPGSPPSAVAAAGSGKTAAPALEAQAANAARSGRAVLPATKPAPGSGAEGPSGVSGPIGAARLSRIARQEASPSAVSGGGTPKPARNTVSQALPLEGSADAPTSVAATSTGGREAGSPLEANVGGQQRQATGLPGSRVDAPAAGALASLAPRGSALPQAMARRAAAAQAKDPSDSPGPNQAATPARAKTGIDLPAMTVAAEDAATLGAAGVLAAGGGAPSRLEASNVVAVGRAAADVPQGKAATASSNAPLAMGAASVPVLAGRVQVGRDGPPSPSAEVAAATLQRTTRLPAIVGGAVDAAATPATAGGGAPSAVEEARTALAAGGAAAATRGSAASLPNGTATAPSASSATPAAPALGAMAMSRSGGSREAASAVADVPVSGPARGRTAAAIGAIEAVGAIEALVAETGTGGSAVGAPAAGEPGVIQVAALSTVRQAAGLPGPLNDRPAVDAATEAGPTASMPGLAAGPRRLPDGADPAALAAEVGGGPLRKLSRPGLARGLIDESELQPITAGEPTDELAGSALAMANGLGEVSRREGGLPVQIVAAIGPGGLNADPSPQVGLPSRRARPESELVHTISRRFVVERSGGEVAIDGAINEPMPNFQHRGLGRRAEAIRARGGSEGTEKAVEMGLDFFARMQFPDGHWSIHKLPPEVQGDDPALGQMESDTAATALALLTYYGGGYTHTDDKHRDVARRGIDWLIRHQQPNGDLFTGAGGTKYAWYYSHGMAAMALCEAYGMTQDAELREPARKAVQFILESQHPKRGGWRYAPRAEADTSVTGWQLQALKSAQMAGIDVPPAAFKQIDGWLDMAQAPGGRYVYNPFADRNRPEQVDGLRPSLAMTAEGMLMRMYLGRGRDDQKLLDGGLWVKDNLPELGSKDRPLRDCYYWYYATQAMFQMQGDFWPAWNERMRAALEPTQEQVGPWAGSWHPDHPVRDRWGHAGGRMYVTSMHLLMLEVYYRVLPLYQELTK